MVSLEHRFVYADRINASHKLKAFHYFLLGKEISNLFNNSISDADEQFLKILSSVQTDNKALFNEIYAKKSKSNPSKDSPAPFVNDDYLIFCLIIAITKFDIDKTWIKNIISIRNRNAITITFDNILNENFSSTSNQPEIVLIFLQFSNQSKISNELLNTALISVTENLTLQENRNDFLVLCAFRAYDFIIYQKEASEGSEITLLKKFNENFILRIIILSWILQAIVSFGLVYLAIELSKYSSEIVKFLNDKEYVFNLFGAIGLTFLSNLIPFAKEKSRELLMRLLGYPKRLLQTKNK